MNNFRAGDFDRNLVFGALRPFCPVSAVERLEDVNLEGLRNRGKKLIMVDVDNTLVQWRQENFAEGVLNWVKQARALGFELCIISNTNHPERLSRLSEILGIPTIRGRFKPSRSMYNKALAMFNVKTGEAVMIGDQLLTDIFGANRAGVEAIWVRKIEGPEFFSTRVINRSIERLIRGHFYDALVVTPEELEEEVAHPHRGPLMHRPIMRQLLKFCVVGAVSFAVDSGILWFLRFRMPWEGGLASLALGTSLKTGFPSLFGWANSAGDASIPVFKIVSAGIAIFVSFTLNRAWTFRISGKAERVAQLRRFYFISVIGLLLNAGITSGLNNAIPGHPVRSLLIAQVIAALIVAVWNFTGQRLYAFKVSKDK